TLLSGSSDKSVIVWDVDNLTSESSSRSLIRSATLPDIYNSFTFSPIGYKLATAGCEKYDPDYLWCDQWKTTIWNINHPNEPVENTSFSSETDQDYRIGGFSPDGKILASIGCTKFDAEAKAVCLQGKLTFWDLENSKPTLLSTITEHEGF